MGGTAPADTHRPGRMGVYLSHQDLSRSSLHLIERAPPDMVLPRCRIRIRLVFDVVIHARWKHRTHVLTRNDYLHHLLLCFTPDGTRLRTTQNEKEHRTSAFTVFLTRGGFGIR